MAPSNRTIIITGASSGMGRLTALKLARRGANVVLAARSAPELATLAAEIEAFGGQALAVPADVNRQEDVDRLVAAALERFGAIDVLINNAGFGVFDPLAQADFGEIERMMSVNYLGPVRCMQAVLPVMRQAGRGHIVNIASVAGLVSSPNTGAYSATKHALVAASQALQAELYGSDITCSLVCPGPVDTPFFKRADYNKMSPLARIFGRLDPDTVAEVIVEVTETRPALRTVPRAFYIFALASKLFPGLTRHVLGRTG
ncbi:MAG TPA: SDR family oxidoreductase [Herpetosiphonaceae bacterium]